MKIRNFIIEEKYEIIFNLIVFICVNIYFITLGSLSEKYGDLVYLDILLISIYAIFFIIQYGRWKKRYGHLASYVADDKVIESGIIKNDYIAEKIMIHIIDKNESELRKLEYSYDKQLKDMEEYISKWVHEIKLPISALNIILERVEDDSIGISIKNEIEKINFLVNSVMYGSRATASKEDIFIREEDLNSIVRSAVKNNAFFLIKNHIEVEIENLNYSIYSDKKWILYVLDQIINNAIKYSKKNGRIKFTGIDEGKYITLNIEDNGIGIAQEDIERIFNKGFTGMNGRNTTYKSTGMGLYFSKKILQKLGHTIDVYSSQGEYTLFKIKFSKISDYLDVAKE